MTPRPPRGRALGRGLDALLPAKPAPSRAGSDYGTDNVFLCAIDKLRPQPGQPRQRFDQDRLEELAQSIREHGLIEPLVVRRVPAGDGFEIIAGDRRWRAAQRAGLQEVLVVVRDVSAHDAFELALIENVQREDLNPIEFADALDRLLREHDYTQDTLAQRLGKDRSTVANALRLLRLPEPVRAAVISGQLSEGHARALLGINDTTELAALAERVARGHLSVRQTEALVRAAKRQVEGPAGGSRDRTKSAAIRDLETRLQRKLGSRCEVRDRNGKGQLVICYSSLDDLDRLLEHLL